MTLPDKKIPDELDLIAEHIGDDQPNLPEGAKNTILLAARAIRDIENPKVVSMSYDAMLGEPLTAVVQSPLARVMGEWAHSDCSQADNFIVQELEIVHEDGVDRQGYVLTIQKKGKKSPAEKYLEQCNRVRELEAIVANRKAAEEASKP